MEEVVVRVLWAAEMWGLGGEEWTRRGDERGHWRIIASLA